MFDDCVNLCVDSDDDGSAGSEQFAISNNMMDSDTRDAMALVTGSRSTGQRTTGQNVYFLLKLDLRYVKGFPSLHHEVERSHQCLVHRGIVFNGSADPGKTFGS